MIDGIAVGAIACLLMYGADKLFKLKIDRWIYAGIFIGNVIFHAFIKPMI